MIELKERKQLTEKQQLVYEGIMEYQKIHGFAPSIRELGVIAGLSSPSSVLGHLRKLEKMGYIARRAESSRAIAVL